MSARILFCIAAATLLHACAAPPRTAGSEPRATLERAILMSQTTSDVNGNLRVIECGYGSAPRMPKLFQKRYLFWLGQDGGTAAPASTGIGATFVPAVVRECPPHLLAAESLVADATSPAKTSASSSPAARQGSQTAGQVASDFLANEYQADIATAKAQVAARRRPAAAVLNEFTAKYGPRIDALLKEAQTQLEKIQADPASNTATLKLFSTTYMPKLKVIDERSKLVDTVRQTHGSQPPEAVRRALALLTSLGDQSQRIIISFDLAEHQVNQRLAKAGETSRKQEAERLSIDELLGRMNSLSNSFGGVLKQSDEDRYRAAYSKEYSAYATALVTKLKAEQSKQAAQDARWRETRLLPALKALNSWLSLANSAHYNGAFQNSIRSNKLFASINTWDMYIGTGHGWSSGTPVLVAWNALLAMAREGTGAGVSFPAALAQSVQTDGSARPVGGGGYERSGGSSTTYVIFATPSQLAAMAVGKGVNDAITGAVQAMGDMTRIMARLAAGVAQSRAAYWSCVQASCKEIEKKRAEFAAWLLEKDNTLLLMRVQPAAAGGNLAAILAGASSAFLGTGPPDGGIHFACRDSFDSVVSDASSDSPTSFEDHVKAMQRIGSAATRRSFLRYQSCRDEMEYLVRRP